LTTDWRPRKPRLHNSRAVRVPKAPLKNGVLKFAAKVLGWNLFHERKPPAALAALIEPDNGRANRSDGLESIWMVIYCLLAFMNLKSFRVGHRQRVADPRRGGKKFDLVGVSIKTIVQATGLDDSTVSHVLTLLRHAGYVHGPGKDGVNVIPQPWETLADGTLAPLPAVRRFTFAFFAELGDDVGRLIIEKRLAPAAPAPPAPATVHPESARALVKQLGDAVALRGPPDD